MKILIAYMRDLEREVAKGKITYIRMVELLNERANEPNTYEPIVSSQVYELEYVLKLVKSYFGPGAAKGCAERLRQIQVKGFTPENDDQYDGGELAKASASYILPEESRSMVQCAWRKIVPLFFPRWNIDWWKPTPNNRSRELEKGIALGMAEIDRLKRKEESK